MVLDTAELERMRSNLVVLDERTRLFYSTLATFRSLRPDRTGPAPRRAHASPVLTARERAILRLIADGRENPEIAEEMHFALGTIKMHVREILAKLGVASRTEAAVRAVREQLI